MYNDSEIVKKRKQLLRFTSLIAVFFVVLIIFVVNTNNTPKREKELPLECTLTTESKSVKGVYKDPVEVSMIVNNGKKIVNKNVGINLNAKNNKDTYTIRNNGETLLLGYVEDETGQTATCYERYNLDLSIPSCVLEVKNGTLGEDEWYTSDIEIGFKSKETNNDNSTISSYSIVRSIKDIDTNKEISRAIGNNDKLIINENGNFEVIGTVVDNNGRKGMCTLTVSIDKEKPVCSLKIIRGDKNSRGEYKPNIVVGFDNAYDAISDVKEKGIGLNINYTDQTFSITDNSSKMVYGFIRDNAGNTSSCEINVDVEEDSSVKYADPVCSLRVIGKESCEKCDSYLPGAKVTFKNNETYSANGTSITSYGLSVNGEQIETDRYIFSTRSLEEGSYTVKGYVQDSRGARNICEIKLKVSDGFSRLSDIAKVGDYIYYDAGNWDKNTDLPEYGCYNKTCFGGVNVESKNMSVSTCESSGSLNNGWKVLSVGEDNVKIVHAGIPECFYYDNTNNDTLNNRANIYLNKTFGTSAKILSIDDYYELKNSKDFDKIFSINSDYYLSNDNKVIYSVKNNIWVPTVTYNKAIGYRPVIELKSDVFVSNTEEINGNTYHNITLLSNKDDYEITRNIFNNVDIKDVVTDFFKE